MHDCLPTTEFMAHRSQSKARELSGKGAWTGDVWKIIPILKKYRPDLSIVCVDAPPTGIVFITNLDPNNKILLDKYMDIVEEFNNIPNNFESISGIYKNIKLISTELILNDFDHSLYFRV